MLPQQDRKSEKLLTEQKNLLIIEWLVSHLWNNKAEGGDGTKGRKWAVGIQGWGIGVTKWGRQGSQLHHISLFHHCCDFKKIKKQQKTKLHINEETDWFMDYAKMKLPQFEVCWIKPDGWSPEVTSQVWTHGLIHSRPLKEEGVQVLRHRL